MAIIMLNPHRHAFPAIAAPSAIGEGNPAYGTRLIIDPKHEDVARLDKAIEEVAKEKWKDEWQDVLNVLKEEKLICFHKTPYRSKKTGKVYDGFEGMYHLGTRSEKLKPTAIDKYGKEIKDKDDIARILYSGCQIRAKVEIWAQDNQFGRRINATLLGAMFAGDGASFGGGSQAAAADDFSGFAAEPSEALEGAGSEGADDLV